MPFPAPITNLFSSSPAPPPPKLASPVRNKQPLRPIKNIPPPPSTTSNGQPPKRSLARELFGFSSDELDSPVSSSGSGGKRRRLSPEPELRGKQSTAAPTARRGANKPAAAVSGRPTKGVAEIIDIFSDSEAEAPPRLPPRVLGNSHDPFGSALPRGIPPAPPARKQAAAPPPKSNKLLEQLLSDELFASTPPAKKPVERDPITSSALQLRPRRSSPITINDSSPTKPLRSTRECFRGILMDSSTDGESDDDLPALHKPDTAKFGTAVPRTNSLPTKPRAAEEPSTVPGAAPPAPSASASATTKKAAPKLSREESERRKEEKKAELERKKQERERARELKAREKELKARERERAAALAEANKVRTDKKVSTREMIVDLPSDLDPTLRSQIEALLEEVNAEHASWEANPLDNVIKWRRKVTTEFNHDRRHWEPVPPRVEEAGYALVVMAAEEFVGRALETHPDGRNLDAHVSELVGHYPGYRLIYLLEGIASWMRKNRSARNRHFASAVRAQMAAAAALEAAGGEEQQRQEAEPPRRKKAKPRAVAQPKFISEDAVEDALLQLQLHPSVLIHHTNAAADTARWVSVFTQHISTARYRLQQGEDLGGGDGGSGFCMDAGQVRSGDGPRDTYVRMLQEIARITEPIAYGIAAKYPTVPRLVEGLVAGGPLTLEMVHKSANKEGVATDRTIGKAVSKRVHKVFTGPDERSTDV